MDLIYLNLFIFPFFIFTFLISIIGHGTLANNLILKNQIDIDLKNLVFIKGLILVGFIGIFINFFFPITDIISLIIIFLGIIIYFFYFIKNKHKIREIIFLLFIVILSFIIAFYAGISDDFNYHYKTIKNFKNKNLFEIVHTRMTSYNSHWLFLNSVYSISYFTSSIFVLTSVFYSITIYDLINLVSKSLKDKLNYLLIISFFLLIFFLGVLNKIKDFGTDLPGVIVSIYILLIIFYFIFEKRTKFTNRDFIFVFLLCLFAFIIKITNSLIIFFLIYLFFKYRFTTIKFVIFLPIFYFIPWIFQNFVISGCLIWPISQTCLNGVEEAINEIYLIESFAKGDISTNIDVKGLSWINTWISNHLTKIFEIYFIFFTIIIIPFAYTFFKKKNKRSIFKLINHYFNFDYKLISIIIILSNLIWFFYAPAYRFGIFYNLTLIIIFILPLWLYMIQNNFSFLLKYAKIILVLVSIYFVIENINKIDWYIKRYTLWPPIKNEEVLKRYNY